MTRDELEISISQYLDGTLNDDRRAAVEARLADDPAAQAILAQERALTDLLRAEPLPEVRWDRLAESISQAIDVQAEQRVARASGWMRFRMPTGLAVAASALLAIGIAAYVLMHGRSMVVNPASHSQPAHVTVASLTVGGPRADVPGGPEVTEISIGAGGSYAAKDAALDPYADEIDNRPARIVIASGIEPDRPLSASPF
jgi:anti-sigma factor RsiW